MNRRAIDLCVCGHRRDDHFDNIQGCHVVVNATLSPARSASWRGEESEFRMTIMQRQIFEAVAAKHGVPVELLLRRCRLTEVVNARSEAMAILREQRLSLPAVGRLVGRNHATVLSGLRRKARLPKLRRIVRATFARSAVAMWAGL